MKIILCDTNSAVVDALRSEFGSTICLDIEGPEVEFHCGSIFEHPASAIVSPANSFGFMNGGFDYLLTQFFGQQIERTVRSMISRTGELLVGQTLTIGTDNVDFPFLIVAPTMRVPQKLPKDSINPYLAARAVFEQCKTNPYIYSVAMTGLGTGAGGVAPGICARQIAQAYIDVFLKPPVFEDWYNARDHQQLLLEDFCK